MLRRITHGLGLRLSTNILTISLPRLLLISHTVLTFYTQLHHQFWAQQPLI
jgi:hypothetical protein